MSASSQEWTTNQTTRDQIQKYVEMGYYGESNVTERSEMRNDCISVLYGLIILMAFLINPFLFFYYEEKQEDTAGAATVRESKDRRGTAHLSSTS